MIGVVSYLIGQCVVTKFIDKHMVSTYMYMYKRIQLCGLISNFSAFLCNIH